MGDAVVRIAVIVCRSSAAFMRHLMTVARGVIPVGGIGLPKMDHLYRHERERREENGYPFYVAGQCHGFSNVADFSFNSAMVSTYSGIL